MKIVIDSGIPYIKGVLEPYAEVKYIPGIDIGAEDIEDAEAMIIRTRTQCNSSLLSGSKVKLIATATIGYDHIDRAWCQANSIEVVTSAGCNARGVLQWFAAVMERESREQGWHPSQRRVGVVGVGNVGRLVAQYAKLWGFEVMCCDPIRAKNESLTRDDGFYSYDELVEQCDILTFHTPLTKGGDYPTHHLFNIEIANKLPTGSLILNSSRGGVTDNRALLYAIERGCRVALDTWEYEPAINRDLLSRVDLATAHIAGYTAQGKANGTKMVVDAVARRFNLPLEGWYPDGVTASNPINIEWKAMVQKMMEAFDIESQSRYLKSHPEEFEQIRDQYNYRSEYF